MSISLVAFQFCLHDSLETELENAFPENKDLADILLFPQGR